MLSARDFADDSRPEPCEHACPDCGRFAVSNRGRTLTIFHRPGCPEVPDGSATHDPPRGATVLELRRKDGASGSA